MSLMMIGFNSCKKEAAMLETQNSVSINNEKAAPGSNYRYYYDNGKLDGKEGVDYGCEGSGGNCLPTVIVTPQGSEKIYQMVINQILKDDIIELKTTLQSNYKIFSEIFGKDKLQSIIDGNATLSVRGTLENNSTAYFLIYKENELIQVNPIQMQ